MSDEEKLLRKLVSAIDGYLEYPWEQRRNVLYFHLLEAMKHTKQEPSYWYVYNEEKIDKIVEEVRTKGEWLDPQ